jgi:hypothetical protein
MIKLKDIGNFEEVPQVIKDITGGDLSALEGRLREGWDIQKEIGLGEYTSLSPLDCALIMENFDSVKWLAEHGAELNGKDGGSFLTAVRYCGEKIIRCLVEHGAKVDGKNGVGTEAYEQALFGKKYKNLPLIEELGHSAAKHGGDAFRSAVSDRNSDAAAFFLERGVDINYQNPDMVYPFKPTALCVAARYVDLAMCQWLVERGADVTIAEKDGMRPYSIAVEKGDAEMAAYFKALEPPEFHSLQNKLLELKPYKLPKALLDFLQGDDLRLEFGADRDVAFIEFFKLTDTVHLTVKRQKLLRISRETDNYSHIYFVWRPKAKKVAYYDMEHEELGDIAPFEDFLANAETYVNKVINGELAPAE